MTTTRSTPILRLLALAVGVVLVVAACSTGGAATAAPSAAPSAAAPSAAVPSPTAAPAEPSASAGETGEQLAVATTPLGDIVVDGEGRTLYLFTKDTQGAGSSACSGDCATNWPPVTVGDGQAPSATGDVTASLGTITRDDGSVQVTLNGWPLYYFAADTSAGDTNGQALNDVWWVISPAGDAIQGGGSGPDEY